MRFFIYRIVNNNKKKFSFQKAYNNFMYNTIMFSAFKFSSIIIIKWQIKEEIANGITVSIKDIIKDSLII